MASESERGTGMDYQFSIGPTNLRSTWDQGYELCHNSHEIRNHVAKEWSDDNSCESEQSETLIVLIEQYIFLLLESLRQTEVREASGLS
jgi:hypothetical protein